MRALSKSLLGFFFLTFTASSWAACPEGMKSNYKGECEADCPRSISHVNKNPPFTGTLFVEKDIIRPSDPSTLVDIAYTGRGLRKMYDRRCSCWTNNNAFLFNANFKDKNGSIRAVQVQVNPEFGDAATASVEAKKYSRAVGRIPFILMKDVDSIWIHKGMNPFGGGNNNLLIHVGQGEDYIRRGILEEAFVHEAVHTSIDSYHYSAEWRCAQNADAAFISNYARDYPNREDHAETFLMWVAVVYRADRISQLVQRQITDTVPDRINFYNDQFIDLYPVW